MAETVPITRHLGSGKRFWQFGREERNAVAVLYALLTRGDNLARFCDVVGWDPGDVSDAEFHVEWTYLRDLWWDAGFVPRPAPGGGAMAAAADPELARRVILDALQPADRDALEAVSILEFNAHFGAVPRPSERFVQSPSNWSVARFNPNIAANDEFTKTCLFKWAFNVKPDLVVQTPSGKVLCIEAKLESGEGVYPASAAEKAIFAERGCSFVRQTTVQEYLVCDLLGFDGTFRYLTRSDSGTGTTMGVSWSTVLQALDAEGIPPFLRSWIDQEVAGGSEGRR